MENRRIILTIALSILVILGWTYIGEYMGWVPPKTEQASSKSTPAPADGTNTPVVHNTPDATVAQQSTSTSAMQMPKLSEGKEIRIETPLYTAVFYTGGGILRSFELKEFKDSIAPDSPQVKMIAPEAASSAPMGLLLNGIATWNGLGWNIESGDNITLKDTQKDSISISTEIEGLKVIRTFTFDAESYIIEEKVSLASAYARTASIGFTLKTEQLSGADESHDKTRVAHVQDNSFSEETDKSDLEEGLNVQGKLSWAGIMSNYFLAAVATQDHAVNMNATQKDKVYSIAMEKAGIQLNANETYTYGASYYLGPKTAKTLEKGPEGLSKAIDYGFFSIIARPLVFLLNILYSVVNNYGIAIILLTVTIKICLWPLSQKSYKSMNQMKKLQPMMAKMREKYKDDRERLNKEMMQLYKTYKVNPLGGCVPMLLQLPIFFGLYNALLNATELRQAAFIQTLPFTDLVWLADLSLKDPYYITPIIMGITMLLQQKMTPSPGDPTQAKIMMLMPVIFTFLFINFSSGLVVYWLVNNVLSIAQQAWVLHKK